MKKKSKKLLTDLDLGNSEGLFVFICGDKPEIYPLNGFLTE